VALTIRCDSEVTKELVTDGVDVAGSSDNDDGTEDTLVFESNFEVVNIVATAVGGSSVGDKEFVAAPLPDCLNVDGVTDVLVVNETEGDTLVEFDVTDPPRSARIIQIAFTEEA